MQAAQSLPRADSPSDPVMGQGPVGDRTLRGTSSTQNLLGSFKRSVSGLLKAGRSDSRASTSPSMVHASKSSLQECALLLQQVLLLSFPIKGYLFVALKHHAVPPALP
jgi:hypothetical protein